MKDEDLHLSTHLPVMQQKPVLSCFALLPPLPYFPLVLCHLYPVMVIYPLLIFPCGEKNQNVTTLTHPELAHLNNPCTRAPYFLKHRGLDHSEQ